MTTTGGDGEIAGLVRPSLSSERTRNVLTAYAQPNNDFCDACHGKGQFLCCEGGCLRSFHFTCLDPPVELDDLPDESWYCKSCRADLVRHILPF